MSSEKGTNASLRTQIRFSARRGATLAATLGALLFGSYGQLSAQSAPTPAGTVGWNLVARAVINPTNGNAFVYGYFTQINGINAPLFSSPSPSEASAYFTFRSTPFQIQPIGNNGDISISNVTPGMFSIYQNSSPHGDWTNPDTFSSGQVIATYNRDGFQLNKYANTTLEASTSTLATSLVFNFANNSSNFSTLIPAVTSTNTFSNTPLMGVSADYPLALAFTGHAVILQSPRIEFILF